MTAKVQGLSTDNLMVHVASKIPTEWYQVGKQLDIETATLDELKEQSNDPFVRVFEQWKREPKVPYTWDTIINTLEKISATGTAAEIREWLDKEQAS